MRQTTFIERRMSQLVDDLRVARIQARRCEYQEPALNREIDSLQDILDDYFLAQFLQENGINK